MYPKKRTSHEHRDHLSVKVTASKISGEKVG